MKNFFFALAGFCAAATGVLLWSSRRAPNVDQLAHSLEEAWADHHTTV